MFIYFKYKSFDNVRTLWNSPETMTENERRRGWRLWRCSRHKKYSIEHKSTRHTVVFSSLFIKKDWGIELACGIRSACKKEYSECTESILKCVRTLDDSQRLNARNLPTNRPISEEAKTKPTYGDPETHGYTHVICANRNAYAMLLPLDE